MDWVGYIENLEKGDPEMDFEFPIAPSTRLLKAVLLELNLSELPPELEELYSQTNGVIEINNGAKIGEFIWPVESVIERNTSFRNNEDFKELYMAFDQLLFFSEAANGDLFGFVTLNGKFDRIDVFVWDHETDSRTWVAPNMATFLKWRIDGSIEE